MRENDHMGLEAPHVKFIQQFIIGHVWKVAFGHNDIDAAVFQHLKRQTATSRYFWCFRVQGCLEGFPDADA